MITLSIPDMSCGHCKASIEAEILRLDPEASVTVDLEAREAVVASTEPVQGIINALVSIGFTATER